MTLDDGFEDIAARTEGGTRVPFVVDIDGYEGPIDVLLALARDQKIDLARVSILQLADQYLAFVAEARRTDLELAADYLVMAAWLAYLKSRLLLPELSGEDEPSGEEMAAALGFQLRRLEAMRDAGARLMARGRLGHDFFARGAPEAFVQVTRTVFEVSLYDLLKTYGEQRRRGQSQTLIIGPTDFHSVDDALIRFRRLLGSAPDWENLWRYLPDTLGGGVRARSALASTFAASLELAREGALDPAPERRLRPHIPARPEPRGRRTVMSGVDAQHLRLLEAILFAAADPVPERVLADRLAEGADVGTLLEHLGAHYAGRGVNLVKAGQAWALRTAPDLAQFLTRETKVERRLSRAAVEILAIIGYHQPVTRAEIEEIRGVGLSRGTLDMLFEQGWIRPKGRRRTPGRPVTWGTTGRLP